MTRWPIRRRLTAWYTGLLLLALAAFGVAIYVGLSYELHDGVDEQLLGQAALVEGGIRFEAGRPVVDLQEVETPDIQQFFRVWDVDGRLVADTGPALGIPLGDGPDLAGSPGGEPAYRTLAVDGISYRVLTKPISSGAAVAGMLEVGLSLDDLEDTLGALRLLLLASAPVMLAAAVGGGYAVAGRALAPVETISALARRISGSDLTARLNLDLPDDEVGRLAGTFDAMLDRVEDAFERQRRFTGDAAHELRTPLSLIRTRVDIALARERPAADYRHALVELDGDVARLSGLVATLLTLARSDAGTLTPDREPVDLGEMLRAVVEQYREAAPGPELRLALPSAPLVAPVDEDLLIQLLVNLIDNAIAHTPADGTITVGCAGGEGTALLWVEDTGTGIAAEHLDRLFDRFYRVDAGRTAGAGGVGLGLSICRAIVEAHGGTIRITSEPGRGTRAEAALPIPG